MDVGGNILRGLRVPEVQAQGLLQVVGRGEAFVHDRAEKPPLPAVPLRTVLLQGAVRVG